MAKRLPRKKRYMGNPRYYSISPARRQAPRFGYEPPAGIARALALDDSAYGHPLTTKQRLFFSRVGMVKQTFAKGSKKLLKGVKKWGMKRAR